jgi:hypothetical protein
MNWGSGDVIP